MNLKKFLIKAMFLKANLKGNDFNKTGLSIMPIIPNKISSSSAFERMLNSVKSFK